MLVEKIIMYKMAWINRQVNNMRQQANIQVTLRPKH